MDEATWFEETEFVLMLEFLRDRNEHRVVDILRLAEVIGIPALPDVVCPPPAPREATPPRPTRRDRGPPSSLRRASTSREMQSPVSTTASGPPAADSGAMWRTMVPKAVPLMRASEMRTMSLTPWRARRRGMGR